MTGKIEVFTIFSVTLFSENQLRFYKKNVEIRYFEDKIPEKSKISVKIVTPAK